MSTAQVFQATRAAANTAANQNEFYNAFDPSAINSTGLDVTDIAKQLQQVAGTNQISSADLAKGAQYYDQNITPFAGNSQWWGPAARERAVLQGYGTGVNPSFNWQQYTNPTLEAGQQKQLGESLMAQQQQNGGGDGLGFLGPLLAIGGMAMGFPELMSMLGGGEALAAGGMSFGPEAFGSAFIPEASVAAGGMSGLPSFMSGLGAGTFGVGTTYPDMENMGMGDGIGHSGDDFAKMFDAASNPSGEGVTSAGGPLANGWGGQVANFMQQNPWMRNVLSSFKGAAGNKNNPLAGALMGYANSMIPGTGGPFSNALGMGSGALSLFQGMDQNRRMKGAYNELNSMSDPMAALRQQGMSRLAALNSDPGGTLINTPGYKAGMDAITRQRAAMGQLGSGNLATALLDYGGNIFNQERGNAMNQIAMAGDPTRLAMMKAQLGATSGAGNPQIMNGLATLGFGLNRMGL